MNYLFQALNSSPYLLHPCLSTIFPAGLEALLVGFIISLLLQHLCAHDVVNRLHVIQHTVKLCRFDDCIVYDLCLWRLVWKIAIFSVLVEVRSRQPCIGRCVYWKEPTYRVSEETVV